MWGWGEFLKPRRSLCLCVTVCMGESFDSLQSQVEHTGASSASAAAAAGAGGGGGGGCGVEREKDERLGSVSHSSVCTPACV